MFLTWGVWTPPYVWTPQHPHMFKHPCLSPMLPCASACSGGICMLLGDFGALLLFGHPHVFGCLPMCPTCPHTFVCSPACLYVLGVICMCCGGTSHMLGVWGTSVHLSGFWCLSVHPLNVCYVSSCTFLVVHYVSSLYFCSYDYYSSSDCGVFWYVISIISDHGSLFDGASYNVGSA